LWKAIRSSISDSNFYELAHALGRHAEFLETFVPLTFVGNHDVTRIASAVPAEHLPHALALLCCVGGTPTIYYGDELGWQGVKEERFGGDDAIRPAFPPDDSGFDADERAALDVYRELIGVRRRHPWLHRATTTAPSLDNAYAVFRTAADDQWLSLALNLSDEPQTLPVEGTGAVLAGTGTLTDGSVELAAHGWAVLGP
jgi:cyclomaltodextrinase